MRFDSRAVTREFAIHVSTDAFEHFAVLIARAGQSTLPSSCPVCEHTPVTAADCKPHKSLRTTIKVFLRTEEKKREAVRLKEEKNTPPDTPIQPEPTPASVSTPADYTSAEVSKAQPGGPPVETEVPVIEHLIEVPPTLADVEPTAQAQQDIPQPSIEVSRVRHLDDVHC
jgi:hypothetical protein